MRELAKPGSNERSSLGAEGGNGKDAAAEQPRKPRPVGQASGQVGLRETSNATGSAPQPGALHKERGQGAAQAKVGAQAPDGTNWGAAERAQGAATPG